MIQKRLPRKLRLILSFLLAFTLSGFLYSELYISGTSKLKMPVDKYLGLKIEWIIYTAQGGKIDMKDKKETPLVYGQETIENIKNAALQPLKQIAPGTYAQTSGNVTQITYRENEVEWVEYTYQLGGKEIKIRVPKGQEKPTQDEVEEMYW
ncbi:MAG: hypothetical protein WC489_06440 [Patescibacteria group bacterium]